MDQLGRPAAVPPARRLRPAGEPELAAAVKRAAEDGLVVRPVGSGHSFTALCVTDDCQVDLSAMDAVLDVDDVTGIARVQAGITLHELSAELHQRGRALENMGDVDTQTVAGAMSTGTHGTGAAFPNLSAGMVGGRLVTADGAVLDLAGRARRRAERRPGVPRCARRAVGGSTADGPGLPAAQARGGAASSGTSCATSTTSSPSTTTWSSTHSRGHRGRCC